MTKLLLLPPESNPQTTDWTVTDDGRTKRSTWATLMAMFFNQVNIPAGGGSPVTRADETQSDHVVDATGVWSGNSYGSTRAASMTALTCYINGRRITISAVTARTFTASKDTYIDVLDNGDGTGSLVYTEVSNNAASPALASNSIRIGIIITGAGNIADAGSVNQGQADKVLPIASSVPYAVTDSLGNLICNRDPHSRTIGYRQVVANQSTTSTSAAQVTPLSCPVILPSNNTRRIKITAKLPDTFHNVAGNRSVVLEVWDGTVGSGTLLTISKISSASASLPMELGLSVVLPGLPTGSKTYNIGWLINTAGTATMECASTQPGYVIVEYA